MALGRISSSTTTLWYTMSAEATVGKLMRRVLREGRKRHREDDVKVGSSALPTDIHAQRQRGTVLLVRRCSCRGQPVTPCAPVRDTDCWQGCDGMMIGCDDGSGGLRCAMEGGATSASAMARAGREKKDSGAVKVMRESRERETRLDGASVRSGEISVSDDAQSKSSDD